ncbi:TetR/AcrR family transcriptional regulator [Desulfarculales bacterium]
MLLHVNLVINYAINSLCLEAARMTTWPIFRNLPPQKQECILDEALSEFADRGYTRASLSALVNRLGISSGFIFQHFHGKSGLFSQAFDFAVGRMKRHLRQVRETTRGQDVFHRLELSLLAGLELAQAKPHRFRLYLKIVFESSIPFRGRLLQSIRLFSRDYILDLLSEAKEASQLRHSLDLAALVVDAALEHLDPELGLYGANLEHIRQRAAQLVELLRRGLGANQRAA